MAANEPVSPSRSFKQTLLSHGMTVEPLYAKFLACGERLSTDTRTLAEGALYIGLVGERFDGNAFVQDALDIGAGHVFTSDPAFAENPKVTLVPDTLLALQAIAWHHRRIWDGPLLAIAGSNGKTTTKELSAAVLATTHGTLATYGNLNNHIGVPMTLLRLGPEHALAVVELGANRMHEIAELCAIAEPTHALVTSIGLEHIEGFGSIQGVLETEGEVYDWVAEHGGIAFIPADDADLVRRAAHCPKQIRYGEHPQADIRGEIIPTGEPTLSLRFTTKPVPAPPRTSAQTQLFGHFNLTNALAAVAVGHHFGVGEREAAAALAAYVPANQRSQIVEIGELTLILDAYNANPTSMEAALSSFGRVASQNRKRIAILGDMLELGAMEAQEHQRLLKTAAALKLDALLVAGPRFKAAYDIVHAETPFKSEDFIVLAFEDVESLRAQYPPERLGKATVLLKGSRGTSMERWLGDNPLPAQQT